MLPDEGEEGAVDWIQRDGVSYVGTSNPESINWVRVQKTRIQFATSAIPKAQVETASDESSALPAEFVDLGTPLFVEQTDIVIQLHEPQSKGGNALGSPQQYRSFAFEGSAGGAGALYTAVSRWLELSDSESAGSKEAWTESVRSRLGPDAVIGGYPSLLLDLLKQQ